MKKKIEFHDLFESTTSVLGWTLTWALMIFGWVAVGQPLSDAETHGRVHMQLEDLKAFVALDSRNPSAAKADGEWNVSGLVQEELGSDHTLSVTMSGQEKSRIAQKIARIETQQEKEIARAEKEYATAVASVKGKRRELQTGRLGNGEKADGDSSKKIFENLLAEANLAALRDAKIEEIKERSLVTVVFQEQSGARKIESIVAGNSVLWGRSNAAVAMRK